MNVTADQVRTEHEAAMASLTESQRRSVQRILHSEAMGLYTAEGCARRLARHFEI